MKSASTSTFRSQLASFLNQHEPVVVKQNGRPKAVLMPVRSEGDVERLLMAGNARLMEILRESDRQIDETGGIPHDEFWAMVDRKDQAKTKAKGRQTKKPAITGGIPSDEFWKRIDAARRSHLKVSGHALQ